MMCENEFYLFRSVDKLMFSAPKLILFFCLKGIVFVRYAEPGVKAHKSALRQTEKALKGMLTPKTQDVLTGKCEVRQTFQITGVGTVAGCYVTEGKIVRGGKLRIYRDDIMICEGGVKQLKRFKDDVKEVNYGYECGCAINGFNEIRVGDIIECYVTEEIKAE